MAEKIKDNIVDERVKPARITDNNTGKVYELDFNRESVAYAEGRGFKLQNVIDFPVTYFPELFYLAFRANHGPRKGNVSRAETNEIYDRMGGFSPEFLERLLSLYNQAALSNNAVETTEEMGKNGNLTVEL